MGESMFFQPTVRNRLSQAIVLANFVIIFGKDYNINSPFGPAASPQGDKIERKSAREFGHCGRENSPTGTEGSFEVRLYDTGEKIAKIYWDCPYIGDNVLKKEEVKGGYEISFEGFSIDSGALNKGTINIRED